MRRWLIVPLLFLGVSAFGQQDLFQWRVAAHAGVTRSLCDIQSSFNDLNWDRSRAFGLEVSKSLGYGVTLGLDAERARLSGYDVLTGRSDRALNFMSKLSTAQLELTFRMDNGRFLKYDARFAPFVTFGVGMGRYNAFGDLYSANGSRYYYWDDGTIRDQAQSGSQAANATVITQDGKFETRLTNLATEDNKPKDHDFLFIPARIGVKWRICDRMAAELSYGFNWTFTDWIDDVHDAYPARQQGRLAYISNPTGRSGQRGDPGTNDKYQSIGLNLAYYFGRRSTSYRMRPIYVDDSSLPSPPPAPKPAVMPRSIPPSPLAPTPTNVVINVERITVGSLSVDTLVVGTLVKRKTTAPDSATYTIRKTKLDSILSKRSARDTLQFDSLTRSGSQGADAVGSPDTLQFDSLMHSKLIRLQPVMPDSLNEATPVRADRDTILPASRDTLHTSGSDSLSVPVEQGMKVMRKDSVVPLPPDTVQRYKTDNLGNSGTRQVVHDTVYVSRERSAAAGQKDTVYVDRPVPAPRQEQHPAASTQQPPQVIIHNEPRERSTTTVVPVPVIVTKTKTETVMDTSLNDSLRKLTHENSMLHKMADSLRADTSRPTIPADTTAALPETNVQSGLSTGDYPMIMNRLLAARIATLERYIAVMDNKGDASETDSLKRRIAVMDKQLETLRSDRATAKDSAGATSAIGTERTIMDTIPFSSGSNLVGTKERTHLLAMGKQLRAAKVPRILVTGQTDRSGNAAFNLRLSQQRADAVKQVLVEAGVPVDTITAKGLGERLASHDYDESERVVVVQAVIPEKSATEK